MAFKLGRLFQRPVVQEVPLKNTILFEGEPLGEFFKYKSYPTDFNIVVGLLDKNKQYPLSSAFSLWQINKSYGELYKIDINQTVKSKLISVFCSNRTRLEGHRQRVKFVNICKEHFKERLDWFGRGYNFVEDKWSAIAPYK